MNDDIRYQIFISSTYHDLKKHRKEVIDIILKMNHFPIGMELFNAGDDDQWKLIEETINDSDYYVAIIGNRYGSVTEDGVSFTEKEYDYALSIKIPILGFIIDKNKKDRRFSEEDEEKKKRLKYFKNKVKQKSCEPWYSPNDLAKRIAPALYKAFRTHPRYGWRRVQRVQSNSVSHQISEVQYGNTKSPEKISKTRDSAIHKADTKIGPRLIEKNIAKTKDYDLVLYDNFNKYEGWENFRNGQVEITSEHSLDGPNCLKKTGYGDPNGGFKKLDKIIYNGFQFTGTIYSPAKRSKATADRLAVENEDFDGYGFGVNLTTKKMWIEFRRSGNQKIETQQNDLTDPSNRWYHFEFILNNDLNAELTIYDLSGAILGKMHYNFKEEIRELDRVVIHGGYDYYIDSIKVGRSTRFDIIKAVYGNDETSIDITENIRKYIKKKQLVFRGNYNNISGDPVPNERKSIVIIYSCGGILKQKKFSENKDIILP